MAQLENETIRLRALEPEDLELLYRWENNPELWSLGNTMSPYSRYILKEYIRESHRDIFDLKQLRLMIELRSTGAAVGTVDLYDFEPHHRRAGIGKRVGYRSNECTDGLCVLFSETASVICAYTRRQRGQQSSFYPLRIYRYRYHDRLDHHRKRVF